MNTAKLIIVFCFLLIVAAQCKKDPLTIANPGYAIGVIDAYSPHGGAAPSFIYFHYTVKNNTYNIKYGNLQNGWYIPGYANYKTGDQYMVQYDTQNTKIARMLFNYPVNDSTDYKNDVILFKTNPPQ